jgi:ATP-dependent helicase YprA (DUF1998 family)
MPLNLDELIKRLYDALKLKFGNDLPFQQIIPDPRIGFNNRKFIPLPSASSRMLYPSINMTWRGFYRKDIINRLAKTNITVDTDIIIGEAIQDRLVREGRQPRPYQHQIEFIAKSLQTLDGVRKWLRGGARQGTNISKPSYDVVALLAPTASGKTEALETIALQVAMDGKKAGFKATKVIMVYPMREFMKDHIKRFIRDLAYINEKLIKDKEHPITIGLFNQDTPQEANEALRKADYLQIFFSSQSQSTTLICPLCGAPVSCREKEGNVEVSCQKGHNYGFVKLTRRAIGDDPPDILLITPDMLNRIIRGGRTARLAYGRVFGVGSHGFPLLVTMDEPHLYSGVFGSNTSLLIRDVRVLISEGARQKYGIDYEPLTLIASATIPKSQAFLSKLLVVDPARIDIITLPQQQLQSIYQQSLQASNKGLVALLPTTKWGMRNAAIEIIPLLAALLPKDERKIIVFVDSTEMAETLVYQIRDYVTRPPGSGSGFWDEYKVCSNAGKIFDSSVCPNGIPDRDFMKVDALHARRGGKERNEVAEEFRSGKVNVVIATSALEVGVDVGDVSVAVLVGLPPTPINFEQRVGRIGRRGQPSLVLIIGNESSGVDVYYLTNQSRLIDYIMSARKYDIPINPANPYSIRAWVGNFVTSLVWSFAVQNAPQERVKRYIDVAIDLPIQVFSSTNLPHLHSISRYLQGAKAQLANQLMSFVDALRGSSGLQPIPLFTNKSLWERISEKWSNILSQSHALLKISTPLLNLRSLGEEIPLYFKVGGGRKGGVTELELKDDILLALSTYSLSELPSSSFNPASFIYKVQLPPSERLRGVVTLKPIKIRGRRVQIPFELAGGTFYPFVPPTSLLDQSQRLQKLRNALQGSLNTLVEFEALTDFYAQLDAMSGVSGPKTVFRRRVKKLKRLLENYVNNVLSRAITTCSPNRPIPLELKIVRPEALVFRPLEPLCFVDLNNELRYCHSVKKQDLENAKYFLFYYEVLPRKGRGPRFVNKIRVDPKTLGARRLLVTDEPLYDMKNYDLVIPTSQGRISYKGIMGGVDVANHVSTFALVLPILLDEPKDIDFKQGNGVEVRLETIKLLYANVGYVIKPNVSGALSYMKSIGNIDEPAIMGEEIETYALEISINWPMWFSNAQRLHPKLYDELERDVQSLPAKVMSGSFKVENAFPIIVAHSLAHALLNFHPLYTGGERRDLGELVLVTRDENGKLVKTRTFVFDAVMGGNGVSELLYNYLDEVLYDALDVMLIRQRSQKPGTSPWFMGDPGDLILGAWPRCIYGNVALSRLWLLKFLAINSGTHLQNWLQGQLAKFSFP